MTRGQDGRFAVPGSIMRQVGLGMADGQLEQADRWLCVADGRARKPDSGRGERAPLVRALLHMRSACGWLTAAAERDVVVR